MSRLCEVWMMDIDPEREGCVAVYAVVKEHDDGRFEGLILAAPPSCSYLVGGLVEFEEPWFVRDDVSRIA